MSNRSLYPASPPSLNFRLYPRSAASVEGSAHDAELGSELLELIYHFIHE